MSFSIVTAIAISVMMIATSIFIIFFHDRKNREFDQWVDFSFSGYTWRRALGYYRFMALSMLVSLLGGVGVIGMAWTAAQAFHLNVPVTAVSLAVVVTTLGMA